MILETPSFEQAQKVWGTEIAVLQRISARGLSCKDDGEGEDGTPGSDSDLVEEITAAVKLGSEKKGGGSAAKTNNRNAVKRGGVTKRKRNDEEREEDEEATEADDNDIE